ncbi:heparin/heparin-sulfate lyase HepB [Paenibacillus qinlingensis]|uniref:heparin/heparin-sulfate lyase HepB n=1 Tax=Paenibacillus qinlingensis TaxID=1837343 RepID=UPI001564B016|nr:heparin/heparin-sulfate lyase HepB [Paenibacillus qinlingensis]NQX58162.1 carboxypeptidase regulatory-like domain-containing protein [Paenibacillus qinlingensis]
MRKLLSIWLVFVLFLGFIPVFSDTVSAAETEIINGGFENGLIGWTQTVGSTGVSVSAEQKFSGTNSLKVVDASAGTTVAVESTRLDAIPGNFYTVTGQVYLASGTTTVNLRFYDGANNVIGTPPMAYVFTPIGAWTGINIAADAPANAMKWSIYLNTGNSNTGTSYYDEIRVYESAPAVLPFHDTFDNASVGSMPNAYTAYGEGDVTVTDMPGGGNRSLTLHDQQGSNAGVVATRTFQPVTNGSYEFETRFRYVSDSPLTNQVLAANLKVMGKTAAGVLQPAAQLRIVKAGPAKVVSATAFNDIPNGNGPLASDKWYTVRFAIDLDNKKYDTYMTSDFIQAGTYIKPPAVRVDANSAVIKDQTFSTNGLVSLNNFTLETVENTGTIDIDYVKMDRKFSGLVRDNTGAVISGANVSLYHTGDTGFLNAIATASTGTNGKYLFENTIGSGSYVLRAIKPGYLTVSNPIVVSASAIGNTELTMLIDSGYVVLPVNGNVVLDGVGSPISGVDVKLYDATDTGFLNPIASSVTGVNGSYTFNAITSGSYVLRAVKTGLITVTKPLTVSTSGVGNAVLTMSEDPEVKWYTIGGKLFEASSKAPIAGAVVKLFGDADLTFTTVLGTATTSADGSFTIQPQVFNGRYRLKAERTGYIPTTSPVAVWQSDKTDEVIAMPVKETVSLEAMPKPPEDVHPRLYLRESDIQGIKDKMTDPLFQKVWDQVISKSEAGSYTAKSSGTTQELETYELPSVQQARYVRIVGRGTSQGVWNSILETKIYGQKQAGVFTSLPIQNVQWSAANGSDYDGTKSIDGNMTTYWTAEGSGVWLKYDLGSLQYIHAVALAWFRGNVRNAYFDIDVSADGEQWTRVDLGMGPANVGQLPSVGPNYNKSIREAIEASALRYVLLGDVQQGNKAISIMKNFLNSIIFTSPEQYNQIGSTINAIAIVYDWCYDLLSDGDRKAFRDKIKAMAEYSEIGYTNLITNAVEGHPSESMVMKDLFAAGVAVYDEDPEIYNKAAEPIFNKYAPVRNFWYESGMHHQGDSYGMQGRYEPELYSQIIMRRMGHEDIFSEKQGEVLMRAIYTRRPDGQLLRDGDSYQDLYTLPNTTWKYLSQSMLAASQYENPYIRDMFLKEYVPGTIDSVMEMLLLPANIVSRPVDELPLTKYFGSPMGSMVARTGWDNPVAINKNSPSVVAEMKMGGYWFGNHQHLDMGSFQLYYQGALAVDSGMYRGVLTPGSQVTQDYMSAHDRNYYKRTIAHNSMLVYDPSEIPAYRGQLLDNDGGQRWGNSTYAEARSLDDLVSKDYNRAKVTGQEYGADPLTPEYSYIKGDLTQAYSDKVKQFERSMMFLNLKDSTHPAAMVVFDKVVSADSNFNKYWLLHSMEKPVVNGSIATITTNAGGYSGKLVNETLLPLDPSVKAVGEHDYNFVGFGKNYDQWPYVATGQPAGQDTTEQGAYRVEVTPKIKAETDYFLNVMQVMDSGETVTLPSQRLDSELMTGAQIADRAVWFSKSGKRLNETVTLSTYGSQSEMLVTVADLQQGTWRILKAGQSDQFGEVSDEGGVLAFRAPAGSYTLTPMGMIDNVAPATRAIIYGDVGAGTFNNHAVTVNFEATDRISGVKKTEYRLNGGAWTTVTDSVYLSSNGIQTLEYRSEDHAGHVEPAKQAVIAVDTVKPTIAWSGVTEDGVYGNVTPVAVASDTLSGIASVTYKLDGAAWTAGGTINGSGNHKLEATATDQAGNKTISTVKFSIISGLTATATLSSAGPIKPGDSFSIKLGVQNVSNVSALDITIQYDENVFDYEGADNNRSGSVIANWEHDTGAGTVRYIIANSGSYGVINGEASIFQMNFSAKAGLPDGSGIISVIRAVSAEGTGQETAIGHSLQTITILNAVSKEALLAVIATAASFHDSAVEGIENGQFFPGNLDPIKVVLQAAITAAQAVADNAAATQAVVNQAVTDLEAGIAAFESGKITAGTGNLVGGSESGITIGDVAKVAYNLGIDNTSSTWSELRAADVNRNGTIDLIDLAFVATRIN